MRTANASRRAAKRERRILRELQTNPWADVPAYSAIVPSLLWQGKPPQDWAAMRDMGVKVVVSCCLEYEPGGRYPDPAGFEMVRFPIDDGDLPDMARLTEVVELVAARVADGVPTYVHCSQGVNRSGLVVALALRSLTGMSGERVIDALRVLRHRLVLCNEDFNSFVKSVQVEAVAA